MDTKKNCIVPKCGELPDPARQRVVVGMKQLRKALIRGCARCVFLAENADPAITGPLAELCEANQVPITWVRSMADLGRACGIEVGAAAAASVD